MKRLLFILATLVAVNCFGAEKPHPTTHQVHKVIRLTKKHIPIGRYFAEDDDEEDYTLVQPMIARRETGVIKARTDIGPAEDDYVLSDEIKLRLMLSRIKALNKYNEVYGSLNT